MNKHEHGQDKHVQQQAHKTDLHNLDSPPKRTADHTGTSGHTHTHAHTKAVLNRLSRAIGHLTAVRNMVESGRDCAEVLVQLAAVRSAINSTCEVILKDHLEHCIVDAVQSGDRETLDELQRAVELLLK